MTVAAATDHKGKGFFIFKGGWEYVGVVGGTAAALSALGPGRYSLDGARGKSRGGLRPSLFSTVLGVGAAVGTPAASRRTPATGRRPRRRPELPAAGCRRGGWRRRVSGLVGGDPGSGGQADQAAAREPAAPHRRRRSIGRRPPGGRCGRPWPGGGR